MFQEMEMTAAIKQFQKGRKVVLLETVEMPDGSTQYQGTELLEIFTRKRLLVETDGAKPEGEAIRKDTGTAAGSVGSGRGKHRLSAGDKERIKGKYLAGGEMEAIADRLDLNLAAVSRYIKESGLGDERYKGKSIPGKGSAEIPKAAAFSVNK